MFFQYIEWTVATYIDFRKEEYILEMYRSLVMVLRMSEEMYPKPALEEPDIKVLSFIKEYECWV